MSDRQDRPFGNDTINLEGVVIPEGEEASMHGLIAALGHEAVQVPALLVPEGADPPSNPYVYVGSTTSPRTNGTAGSPDGDPGAPASASAYNATDSELPRPAPPVPSLAQMSDTQMRPAMPALRGAKDAAARWRAMHRAAAFAQAPEDTMGDGSTGG